jgi:MATE family, multidrug efflux pump
VLRSPHDRDIARLAVPALGALAAEPLYLLVDTAIVGHLGTPQLAALALAATVLSTLVSLCIFLTYGTTAQVARLHGSGDEVRAGELAAQALWLAVAIGAALALACVALADPLIALLGGAGHTADMAARYLRLSATGLPMALVALAGQGYLRGTGDLRTPLVVVVAAQAVNVGLELWLVYGLDLGLDGSAAGTVIAQLGMGGAFAWLLLRAPAASRALRVELVRPLLGISGELFVRSAALLVAFATASAIIARIGEASLAAHQVAMGLFLFVSLVLDAIAIAAQVIVGRALGAGDAGGARAAACSGGCCWRSLTRWRWSSPTTPRSSTGRARSGRCSRSCSLPRPSCSRWTGSSSARATRAFSPARCCSPDWAPMSRSPCWRSPWTGESRVSGRGSLR